VYRERIHGHALESAHHPSRTQVKRLHARSAHEIAEARRIFGETMQAMHSITFVPARLAAGVLDLG